MPLERGEHITLKLNDNDPAVSVHADDVSLHGYESNHGALLYWVQYSIHFTTAQIPQVRELLAALEDKAESKGDTDESD